jgi:hypothetical protein
MWCISDTLIALTKNNKKSIVKLGAKSERQTFETHRSQRAAHHQNCTTLELNFLKEYISNVLNMHITIFQSKQRKCSEGHFKSFHVFFFLRREQYQCGSEKLHPVSLFEIRVRFRQHPVYVVVLFTGHYHIKRHLSNWNWLMIPFAKSAYKKTNQPHTSCVIVRL